MNILVFFAHPDDESILCGGLLALLAKAGHHVHYLCCTRGEGGECGKPPLCSQEELGSVRERELLCAVNQLGGKSLKILNYVDPLIGLDNTLHSFSQDIDNLTNDLSTTINENNIEILISHGSNGEYGHPGHLTVYLAAKNLIQNKNISLAWYTVQGFYENSPKPHLLNKNDPADWVIDVTAVMNEKVNAALCHRTQHNLFVRRKSQEVGREVSVEEVIQNVESYHFVSGPSDFLRKLPEVENHLFDFGKSKDEV